MVQAILCSAFLGRKKFGSCSVNKILNLLGKLMMLVLGSWLGLVQVYLLNANKK
jgi:hypothetical protein